MFWPYLYDVLLVMILVIMTMRGKKTGLFAALIRLLGWVVALFLIVKYSEQLASWIYINLLRAKVINTVNDALPQEIIQNMNSAALSTQDALNSIQSVLDSLGGILGSQTIDLASTEEILQLMQTDGATLAQIITDTILEPVLIPLIQAILSVLLFLICIWIFKLIAAYFAKRNEKSGTGLNSVLGGVVGFGEGALIGYIYGYILKALSDAVGSSIAFLSPAIWQKTILLHRLIK